MKIEIKVFSNWLGVAFTTPQKSLVFIPKSGIRLIDDLGILRCERLTKYEN